jgi:GntR family transcriptional regulator
MSAAGKNPVSTRTTVRLNHNSSLPLHAQAENVLREMIVRPEYRDAGFLPDEVSLSRKLGISRNTLRHAIAKLVAEGRLERKAGIGTRVIEPRVESGVGAWHSFTKEMAAKGIQVETYTTTINMLPASADVAKALKIAVSTPVLCVDRVRGWDKHPEVHFRSCLHPRLGLTPSADFSKPLYELIQTESSIVADESLEELTATTADRALARLLQVKPGTPLLRRARTVLDTARRPMEFAVVHYRCERFSLTLNLRHE